MSVAHPEDEARGVLRMTVPQLLRARATLAPHRVALSARSHTGVRSQLTYADLVQRMDGVARSLHQRGIGRGDRVAVYLTNEAGLECISTALGAIALGAVVVPLNTRYAEEELRHALTLTAPALVVTMTAGRERIRPLLDQGARCALVEDGVADGSQAPHVPALEADDARGAERGGPDDLATLLFTSGTTARSKAVMHSHRTMIATGLCCGTALGITAEDGYQGAFPFFTSSALNLACMSCWVQGARFIYEGVLDNAGRLALMEDEQATIYHGVPSVLSFMVQAYDPRRWRLRALRRIAYGGAAMPAEVAARIGAAWPWADQVQIYGLTESGPTGTVLSPTERRARTGSVGRAMRFCDVRVVDDAGTPQQAGHAGEIVIEGPAVALGYYRDEAATSVAFRGGAVRTGDVGHLDIDGFLYFADRKKDVINRGGLKIASVAVEDVLCRHPAVREVAVVAVPHRDLGEDVAAFVVVYAGQAPAPDELAGFCRDKLADYEIPRRWFFVEELPKNPMGKVLKGDLRRDAVNRASLAKATGGEE